MREFALPSLGADMDEGMLADWLVEAGDTVTRGQVIAEVETDKKNNHRRFVFKFDPVQATAVRARLLESDRALRICEIRIYE